MAGGEAGVVEEVQHGAAHELARLPGAGEGRPAVAGLLSAVERDDGDVAGDVDARLVQGPQQPHREPVGGRHHGVGPRAARQELRARAVAALPVPARPDDRAAGQAQTGQCVDPAQLARVRLPEALAADQQTDGAASVGLGEVPDEGLDAGAGRGPHGRAARDRSRAVQQDDGDPDATDARERVHPAEGAGEHETVHLVGQEVLHVGAFAALVAARVRGQDALTGGGGGLRDGQGQLGAVRVERIGDDEADGLAGAAPERAGAEVGAVLEHLHRLPDAFGRAGRDRARAVVEHVAHDGGADAGVAGHIPPGDRATRVRLVCHGGPLSTRPGGPPEIYADRSANRKPAATQTAGQHHFSRMLADSHLLV